MAPKVRRSAHHYAVRLLPRVLKQGRSRNDTRGALARCRASLLTAQCHLLYVVLLTPIPTSLRRRPDCARKLGSPTDAALARARHSKSVLVARLNGPRARTYGPRKEVREIRGV